MCVIAELMISEEVPIKRKQSDNKTRRKRMEMTEIMEMSMDALGGYYSCFVREGGE